MTWVESHFPTNLGWSVFPESGTEQLIYNGAGRSRRQKIKIAAIEASNPSTISVLLYWMRIVQLSWGSLARTSGQKRCVSFWGSNSVKKDRYLSHANDFAD